MARFVTMTVLLMISGHAFGMPLQTAEGNSNGAQEMGRACTSLFYEGKVDDLWARFNDAMQGGMESKEKLAAFRDQVAAQLGPETAMISEKVNETGGMKVYLRHARFEKFHQPVEVMWAFAGDGQVAAFYVRPAQKEAPTKYLDYETKTDLRLPFEDPWNVFWGGRTLAENYHAIAPDQRFAYDLLVIQDGSTHRGNGTSNDQYHSFGRRVVAPAGGTVLSIANDVPDNKPGEMNPQQALGNHVIIDHGNGEFSFLAHFKQGSVAVSQGQKIQQGEFLGECGNSGNSSEAHLHYHLQTTGVFQGGEGLPAQFQNYTADGEKVDRGEPKKNQVVEPQPDK